jgi:chromosome partitioning protein
VRSILVVNPKGGSGKTTVATNLAGALAGWEDEVMLWDLDRQQSALTWLSMRPAHLPRIVRLDRREDDPGRINSKRNWLVIDSPAGLHGKGLSHTLRHADKVVVPVQPSVFDMAATSAFLQILMEEKAVRRSKAVVGVVGVRVDPRTRAAATLEAFLQQFDLPVLAYLRDSQIYPNAAFNGMSIFDLAPHVAAREQEHWQPIVDWLRLDADRPASGSPEPV